MDAPTTTGAQGQANVGTSTIASTMTSWPIPEQFRDQATKSVNLLLLATTEGSYLAQAFVFDIPAGTSLTTLLVVATKLDSPTDSNLPFAVIYVVINSNASIKQQYTYYSERTCHRCPKCAWLSACCCHDEQRSSPRGHTAAELDVVKQKLTFDQFRWFNQQNFSPSTRKLISIQTQGNNDKDNQYNSLIEAIERFLSDKIVKAEVLAPYNDSILNAIQTNLTSLKLATQTLKIKQIEKENMLTLLRTLADEHGFDEIFSNPEYSQQLQLPRFSYESLFAAKTGPENKNLFIKYVWVLGQTNNNMTYALNFLVMNITSKSLISTILSNSSGDNNPTNNSYKLEALNIVRTSKLDSNRGFFDENLFLLAAPWNEKKSRIILNMLRFTGASVFVPKKFTMLSDFHPNLILPGTEDSSTNQLQSRDLSLKIQALAKAVSAASTALKDVIQTLKSSSSTTIQRIIRFGFNYFNQRSTVLKAIDIPRENAAEFINAVIIDYNLPPKGSFMLGLTYSDDFAWDRIDFLYSPAMNGSYNSLTLFKNGDSTKNTASFFIVDINANWILAPDLLMITEEKSILGGLISSSKQSIQEIPHVLTFDEAIKLQQFFMFIALGNIANSLGANITFPQIS